MKYLSQLSLRGKVVALVLFGIATVTTGSFFALSKFADSYEDYVQEQLTDDASGVGDRLGAQLYERYGDVQAFAVNQTVRELNTAKMPAVLDQYVKLYGIYDLILVVDTKGNPLASNLSDTAGKPIKIDALAKMNFKEAPWFKEVMAGRTTDSKELNYSGTYVELFLQDPLMTAAAGEDRYATGFSSAIRNDKGDIIGVITNRANTRWFETDLKDVLNGYKLLGRTKVGLKIFTDEGLLVFDHQLTDGNDVKHSPDVLLKRNLVTEGNPAALKAVKHQSGFEFTKSKDGEALATSYHHIENMKWQKELGWNVMVSESADESFANEHRAKMTFYILIATCLGVSLLSVFWVTKKISQSVTEVTEILSKNGQEVAEASGRIAASSTQLSESSTEQAAALQETVAAVDEISAMVEKNAESANRSKESSAQSREAAENGRKIVENMLQAIDEIDRSNSEISGQMDESNRQLSEITKLINDIGSKTKVINEIVFQTKLLSFNASVEAARAGEYGKGFAVVAEEVGNLAEMSGAAAKEISSLLDESVRKVEHIVSETKTRVDRSMGLAREKVAAGSATAKECNQSLDDILRHVQEVDGLVSEIAVASSEQATGIREISKAVGQMEQVTQQNSSVAQSSSVAAEQLSRQSGELNAVVGTLQSIVKGGEAEETAYSSAAPTSMSKPKAKAKTTAKTAEKKPAKIMAMVRKPSEPVNEAPLKAASGDYLPSADDPRFSE